MGIYSIKIRRSDLYLERQRSSYQNETLQILRRYFAIRVRSLSGYISESILLLLYLRRKEPVMFQSKCVTQQWFDVAMIWFASFRLNWIHCSYRVLYALDISGSKITRYWTQYERNKDKTFFRLRTHERQQIPRPDGRDTGRFSEFFGRSREMSSVNYSMNVFICKNEACSHYSTIILPYQFSLPQVI